MLEIITDESMDYAPTFEKHRMYNMTDEQYFSTKGAISRSDISKCVSGAYGYFRKVKSTTSMNFGRCFHSIILDGPDEFLKKFYFQQKGQRKTKALVEEAGGKDLITHSEHEVLNEMSKSLMMHPLCPDFNETVNEKVVFGKIDDVPCKAKIDAVDIENGIIYDLKTIRSIDDNEVYNAIYYYKLNLQAYFYTEVMKSCFDKDFKFILMFVEKLDSMPQVRFVEIDDFIISSSRELFVKGMENYNKAIGCSLEDKYQIMKNTHKYKYISNFTDLPKSMYFDVTTQARGV